jgi:hypothetical protein
MLGALPGHATERPEPGLRMRDLTHGTTSQAPSLDMEVSLRITGPITRARVTQRFRNDGDGRVEGVYVFPLPAEAAVDALSPLTSHALPGTLPTGTTPQAFAGVLPGSATLSPFLLYAGVLCCALSVFGLRIQERLR